MYEDKDGVTNSIFVDFVSEVLDKDPSVILQAIEHVISQDWFNFKTVHFVSDCCGGQFRNYEFISGVLVTISEKFNIQTDHRFLGSNHSKQRCDRHFSIIRQWYETLQSLHIIVTTDDFVNSMRLMASNGDQNQNKSNNVLIFKFEIKLRRQRIQLNNIDGVKFFFCFKRDGNDIVRKVHGDAPTEVRTPIQIVKLKPLKQWKSLGGVKTAQCSAMDDVNQDLRRIVKRLEVECPLERGDKSIEFQYIQTILPHAPPFVDVLNPVIRV